MDSRTPSSDPDAGQDPAAPAPPILERIRGLLRSSEIEFRELHHEPTRTSEDSARVRGEDLRIGGKALLIKVDDEFRLFVLSAALRVDSQAIRAHLNARRTRFASAEELAGLTGLVPGAVPPFGRPILPFTLYVDPSITEYARIAFNAGSLTDSVFLKVEDYPWRNPKCSISAADRERSGRRGMGWSSAYGSSDPTPANA